MPDLGVFIESLAAGGLCGGAVLFAGGGRRVDAITARLGLAPEAIARTLHVRYARDRLARDIERAGWHESPERAVVFAVTLAACLAVLGLGIRSPLMSGVGIAVGLGLPLIILRNAIVRRRRRLEGELVPLLELFTLELSGGGGAISALGAVTMQVQGELAADLRRLLIASQVAGSASFESRLVE
jgi:Flp pilus assembly protein TadB